MTSRAKLLGENREKNALYLGRWKKVVCFAVIEILGRGEASEGNSFPPLPHFFAHPRRAPTLACSLVPSLRLENEWKRLLRGPVHTPSKCVIDSIEKYDLDL